MELFKNHKFKIGDVVRVIDPSVDGLVQSSPGIKGNFYIISLIGSDGKFQYSLKSENNNYYSASEGNIKLVKCIKAYCFKFSNGEYKWSSSPNEYHSKRCPELDIVKYI